MNTQPSDDIKSFDTGRFIVDETPLSGVYVIERKPLGDSRGFLERLYCTDELKAVGFDTGPVQINRTFTQAKGTLRGLHFQHAPKAERKIISCLKGKVFDVAVDLRKGSPSFLQWFGTELSEENNRSLVIPEGCAHGFQTLLDDCALLYFHSKAYAPEYEAGYHFADETLAIAWPLKPNTLSGRDNALPVIEENFEGLIL